MSVCANCGQRKGTVKYTESGGALALVHGFYAMWCELCVAERQLAHARERAAAIPKLEARVAKLKGAA